MSASDHRGRSLPVSLVFFLMSRFRERMNNMLSTLFSTPATSPDTTPELRHAMKDDVVDSEVFARLEGVTAALRADLSWPDRRGSLGESPDSI